MRHPVPLAAVALAALLVAGCGDTKIDHKKGERFIKSEIEKVTGDKGVTVKCPSDKTAKKGEVFYCTATATDKTTQQVKVVERDAKGNVHMSAPILHTGETEQVLIKSVAGNAAGAKVDCPDLVVPVANKTMTCKESIGSNEPADVVVKFTGEGGKFNIISAPTTAIDPDGVGSAVTKEVEHVTHATGVKTTCPAGLIAQQGKTFTCKATGADGTTATANITETDSDGNVHIEVPVLHTHQTEQILARGIKGSKHGVKVDCPDLIVPKTGDQVICSAKASDGTKARVQVTFTNNTGRFGYKLLTG